MRSFSSRHKFADWPNSEVPAVAVGVYAVWDRDVLVYCGMSGREFEKAVAAAKPKYRSRYTPRQSCFRSSKRESVLRLRRK